MSEPQYVKVYCDTCREQEMERTSTWLRWRTARQDSLGLTLAEKVDGSWRCCCCGKPVSVVW